MLKPLVAIAIVVVLILLASEGLLGLFSSIRLVSTRGNLQIPQHFTIYQDRNCTDSVSYIDWGSIEPGIGRNITVYICNEGKGEVNLSLDTTNWQPANISSYMNLTWNYNGAVVFPGETTEVDLILSSSSSPDFIKYLVTYDVKEFSFDIVISALS